MEAPQHLESALVGRDEELALLDTFLDATERLEPAPGEGGERLREIVLRREARRRGDAPPMK